MTLSEMPLESFENFEEEGATQTRSSTSTTSDYIGSLLIEGGIRLISAKLTYYIGDRAEEQPKSSSCPLGLLLCTNRCFPSPSYSLSPQLPSSPSQDLFDTHDLLEKTFSYYFPSNISPDDAELRDSFKQDLEISGRPLDTTLDDILSPLVVLCTKLCLADERWRLRTREWILPLDLDCSNSLERFDFLGRCLRLLGSIYHTRLKGSVGEMLFAMSDSDPSMLSKLVGCCNVADFLSNKLEGILSTPLQTLSSAPLAWVPEPISSTGSLKEGFEQELERCSELVLFFDRFK